MAQTALSTHSIRSVPLTVLRVKTLVALQATATPVIPRARARSSLGSQLFQIQPRPLESRSQEDRKPNLALSETKEQWRNQVQTQGTMEGCPTGTTHSTASTMIKEMVGVGGMG